MTKEEIWRRLRRCSFVVIVGTSQLSGFGKCPGCNSWNSFYEEKLMKSSEGKMEKPKSVTPTKLNSVIGKDAVRTSTGFDELDRVLGRWFSRWIFGSFRW